MSVISSALSRKLITSFRNNNSYTKLKIQLFGDSVLWGYLAEGGGVRLQAYPELLIRNFFERNYGIGEISVETRAVNGTYTRQLLEGTDGLNLPWPQSINGDVLILNHGVNDSSYIAAGLWTQAQYTTALQTLISQSPVPVILLTPTPVNNANPNLAPLMRNVASSTGTRIIDVRAYIDTIPNWYANYAPDGIHLNNDGYKLIYDNYILTALKTIIDEMSGR